MERRIGMAGDWHGNVLWTESQIRLFAEVGITSVQRLGDFDLWPGPTGKMFHHRVGAECECPGVRLFVVLGNHDDHDRVASMRTDDDCACLAHNVREQGWPRVDVMLTHRASAGQRRLGMSSRPLWLTPEVEAY